MLQDVSRDEWVNIFYAINTYTFAFTLVGLLIGTYVYRSWRPIGPWFRHTLCWYVLIKIVDFYGDYWDLTYDKLFFNLRQSVARNIINWGIWYCFLYWIFKESTGTTLCQMCQIQLQNAWSRARWLWRQSLSFLRRAWMNLKARLKMKSANSRLTSKPQEKTTSTDLFKS